MSGDSEAATMRVVGLCHAIRDFTFVLRPDKLRQCRDMGLFGAGVAFLDEGEFRRVYKELCTQCSGRVGVDPGGPVSNTLYAIGARLPRYPRRIELHWSGPYSVDIGYVRSDPLASLRSVGVRIHANPCSGTGLRESICVVSWETGEAEAVLVGPRPAEERRLPSLDASDLVLVQLADLAEYVRIAPPTDGPAVAMFTADCERLTDETRQALDGLGDRGLIRFAFGKRDEFERLALLDPAGRPAAALVNSELVATRTAQPVYIVGPRPAESKELPVLPIASDERNTFIGAGDAYAGAYLCARLLENDVDIAHRWGTSEARLASYSPSARRSYTANLTDLFGAYIERQSDTDDWEIHGRVRQTSGLTIVACGTSGVDELALAAAEKWGLAAFAVLKRAADLHDAAHRGDEVGDDLGRAHRIELGSDRNRYATWANVFLGDGTMLLDFENSEGSEETRRACRVLNRPLLELAHVPFEQLDATVRAWVADHAVRVVHFAGNRSENIPPGSKDDARRRVERSILSAAGLLGQHTAGGWQERSVVSDEANTAAARIGFPRLQEMHGCVERFLASRGAQELDEEKLSVQVDGVQICFGRSLDLVRMLHLGILDCAYVGSDMLTEFGAPELVVCGSTGVFNAVLAVVAPNALQFSARRLVAQYPAAASRYFERDGVDIVQVRGAAETWVQTGEFDGAVDTWRTGQTAEANGLEFVDAVASTSLTAVRRPGASAAATRMMAEFWDWIAAGAGIE